VVLKGIRAKMLDVLEEDDGLFDDDGELLRNEDGSLTFDDDYGVSLGDLL
jgi:hypothetical protein